MIRGEGATSSLCIPVLFLLFISPWVEVKMCVWWIYLSALGKLPIRSRVRVVARVELPNLDLVTANHLIEGRVLKYKPPRLVLLAFSLSLPFSWLNTCKMPVEITRMVENDIDGAVDCIQKAFAEDPYFAWVFPKDVRLCTSVCLQFWLHEGIFRLCLVCSNHITSSLRHGIASRLVSAVDGALSTLCFTLPKTLHLPLLRASLVLLVGWLQRIPPLHSLGKAGSATGRCGSTNSG